jgi:hypothetical protein
LNVKKLILRSRWKRSRNKRDFWQIKRTRPFLSSKISTLVMVKAQPSRLILRRSDLLMVYLNLLWQTILDKLKAQIPLAHLVLDLSKSKMATHTHLSLSLSCLTPPIMMMVTLNSMVSKWLKWTIGPKPRCSLVWTKRIHWEFLPLKISNCHKIN